MTTYFASDNNAGVHPEVLRAIADANGEHAASYGADEWSVRLSRRFAEAFGEGTIAFPVFNGSAANTLALRHLTQPWEAVICATTAHINSDECGSVEALTGRKLLTYAAPNGKLEPSLIGPATVALRDVHRVQPRVISISQATEYGTIYTLAELRALCDEAHAKGLLVHMDGARIGNAAAALGVDLRECTRDAGVDALSFGGTKNGLMGAEAVVFFEPRLAEGFGFTRKQMLQLGSKMRFLAVQLEALFIDDLWRRSAAHANEMTALLAELIRGLPSVEITQPVETNAIFARIPRRAIERLQRTHRFAVWDPSNDEVRWMTAFDTTEESVRDFAAAIRAAVGSP